MRTFGRVIGLLALGNFTMLGTVCIEMPQEQAFRNAAAVVEVEIAEINAVGLESRNQRANLRATVIRTFKGSVQRSLLLPVLLNSDMGYVYRFRVGETYILYLKATGNLVRNRRNNLMQYYLGMCPGRLVGPTIRDLDNERSVLSSQLRRQ